MFADDNFPPSSNSDLDTLITELKNKLNTITKWLRDSGLKINEEKTELCLLHRNDHTPIIIMINNTTIQLLELYKRKWQGGNMYSNICLLFNVKFYPTIAE